MHLIGNRQPAVVYSPQLLGGGSTSLPGTQTTPRPAPASAEASRPPLVVLLGPTASGKTALAIQLANAFDGEIVSADSRQIYCHMDIGTAKPGPAERAAAPHHLIDIVAPDQTFTAAEYQREAYRTINSIQSAGKLPLLVGGTGQYITAVVEGWGIPEVLPNPRLRRELEDFAADHGAAALHARLREADPLAADRIDFRNVRRVVRALEVFLESGTPISVLQQKQPPPYRILQIGLTLPREALYARVDARIDRMLAEGLADEVRALLDAGYTWEHPAMSGLGYAQWRPVFEQNAPVEQAAAAIRRDTRAYIRRQYTWFKRHNSGTHWVNVETGNLDGAFDLIRTWLAAGED
ncbi:tRNA (adenosine(37)-N6)-dimethylallyltransferase MiaA [Aggregatilinea lenta]|uniref:tRNA (adenosine(37)-N6)-dimethylallyltransferase MiaA n=1 Tax=Aggregatilinea lenta TaxID=913108 RepID=UPI000E5A848D|nr:tRNA (adenosine(37)-N6)-dimethylallyltransferase MiaA [Aggregatilinea lenta]